MPAPSMPLDGRRKASGATAPLLKPEIRVLKWKDGKRAAFMVEFDDSAPSHLEFAIPALKNRGIPGTFYINPGNGPYKSHQSAWEQAAACPLIELSNHTFRHIGAPDIAAFENEITEANAVIDRLYPDRPADRLRDWARPGVPAEQWKIGEAEISAVLARHRMIERPPFFGPPFSIKTTAEMLAWVDGAIAGGEMRHLVFHGVGGDWHSVPINYFLALLDKLDACAGDLWITHPLSYHKYETERRTAKTTLLECSADGLRISLTTDGDPHYYDHPLTLSVTVPGAWKRVVISQGRARRTVTAQNSEVRFDALPGSADIVLTG